jgi:hypothetical protein
MKRKKAIKEKKEALAKLDIEIMSKANEMMDWCIERKDKKDGNFFETIAKSYAFIFEVKSLMNQKKIISDQPIPPKKLKLGGCVIVENQTELILKTPYVAGEKINKGDAVYIDNNVMRKCKYPNKNPLE